MVSVHVGGGGIRAAFISKVLDNVFEGNPSIANSIQVSSGVSAGSIVASCISTKTSLSDALESLNSHQYIEQKNICSSGITLYRMWNNKQYSFYSNNSLQSAMRELFQSKKCHCDLHIALAEAGTFRPISYKFKPNESIKTNVITASCSIPGLFSPVQLDSSFYMDAGTVQELDKESIKGSLRNPAIKLHIVCSCHPWKMSLKGASESYHPEFTSMAKSLASMLWDTGVRQAHYNDLRKVFGVGQLSDGRSMLCMKRMSTGFKCIAVLTPRNLHNIAISSSDFFVLMIAPSVDEYVGFEKATLLDSPSERRPVIEHMLTKCPTASSEALGLISACGLGNFNNLAY